MSWDPNTAVVLYQPIDFYAIASKEVSKSRTLISKTEDIKKYITPFTSTSQDRLAIRNNIKIITTNIPHESIEDLLTQAKVIMVAERHLMQSDRLNIARMINSFNPSDIQLLVLPFQSSEYFF